MKLFGLKIAGTMPGDIRIFLYINTAGYKQKVFSIVTWPTRTWEMFKKKLEKLQYLEKLH